MEQRHVVAIHSGSARFGAAAGDDGSPLWWLLLVTGSLWILFSLIVFRFDYTSVTALSILLGTVCLAAALGEAVAAATAHGWGRAARIVLAILFAVVGIVAFIHPGDTFRALAAIFAFYLLLRGIFEVIMSLVMRGMELWWLGLASGIVQILLAFWAAGDFGHKAFLLVVWVGATALAHGILQLVLAFQIRPRGTPPLATA
jgi:uncharacterized membrane protein HdeD (DUF308 family)